MNGKIAEIFESIQGEGIHQGISQVFIRFYGCNLNCEFCDTKLKNYNKYSSLSLLNRIQKFKKPYHSICFTGGEPLLQKNFLKEILILIKSQGITTYLETNGTLFNELFELIDNIDIVAMDFKLPSSTQLSGFWDAHQKFLEILLSRNKKFFIKAVITTKTKEEDLERACNLILRLDLKVPFILQPNSFELNKTLLDKIQEFQKLCTLRLIDTRIIPQIHKILGLK